MNEWALDHSYASSLGTVRWDRLGAGDPVVLLHGTPFSSFVWRDIAYALAQQYEVFVWDMLGYGASEKADGQDVSLAAQTQVFAELLEHWGLERPSVIAHDFGGALALRAHLLTGVPYRRLALVDVVALSPWGSPFFRLVREHSPVFAALPAALHEALVRAYIASASSRELGSSVMTGLVAPWLGDAGQAAFYRQIAQADQRHTDEFEGRLSGIEMRVLICWGTEDTWIAPSKAEELAARIPGADLRWLHGAGHLVQENAAGQLTAALAHFLTLER
jgi:pimeloyl-ACP methyl ester carboxylesterase